MGSLGSAPSSGIATSEEEVPFPNSVKALAGNDPIRDPLFYYLLSTVKAVMDQV